MRPARMILAAVLAAAVAGCGSHTTADPSAAPDATAPDPGPVVVVDRAPPPAPTTPRAPHRTTPRPSPPRPPVSCRTDQLQLRADGFEGATGQRYLTYALRNRSAVRCTMAGTPTVRLLDAGGHALPIVPTRWDLGAPVGAVPLRPGASAYFTMRFAAIPRDTDPQPCPAAATIAVTPPRQRGALTIPASAGTEPFAPCGGGLGVSPVRATA